MTLQMMEKRDEKGRFIKGHEPWHKGRTGVYSIEIRMRMRSKKLRNGYINKDGYKVIRFLGNHYLEHRYIWEKHKGYIPKGYTIHHIDGNKLNNKIENLQLWTNKDHVNLHWKKRKKEVN